MDKIKKLLVFGGAFNPPHKGHELLLSAAAETIRPDLTIILPTATSPHKQDGEVRFSHRVNMARVFKKITDVKICDFEGKGRKKRNYTIQSLKRLEKKYAGYEIYLLIGGDMLESFYSWSRCRRIIAKTILVTALRTDEDEELLKAADRVRKDGGKVLILQYQPFIISSSELRKKLSDKEDVSGYMDETVVAYINKFGLYK